MRNVDKYQNLLNILRWGKMLIAIIIYILILVCIGIYDSFKIKEFKDYAVAGKNQSFLRVFLSMMATIIGASATIGVVERVTTIGFASFWWLGVGAIGLFFQSLLLSQKIRELDANTLPDIADKTIGTAGKNILAIVISVSWIGIIAAQFVSIAEIISVALPSVNRDILLIIISIIVIIYTIIGGQVSVIKTDSVQYCFIVIGILATVLYIFLTGKNNTDVISKIEFFNKNFDVNDFISLLFITGGAYFLGPDIISRNLIAKDGRTAKKAAIASAITLLLFSFVITLIGLWAVVNISDEKLNAQNPLIYIMNNHVPYPLEILLCVALLATLVSSVDTCMINAASIIEHDLLKRKKVKEIRLIVGTVGILGLFIALLKDDIIGLLSGAYSIYVPGIVCPLFISIWFYKKKTIRKKLWFTAVIVGGLSGILHSYMGVGSEFLPLIGMGVSCLFSILSVL